MPACVCVRACVRTTFHQTINSQPWHAQQLPTGRYFAQAAQALIDKMTERSRAALHGMSRWSDCTVETADGLVFSLHKSVLGEASIVLRYAYISYCFHSIAGWPPSLICQANHLFRVAYIYVGRVYHIYVRLSMLIEMHTSSSWRMAPIYE